MNLVQLGRVVTHAKKNQRTSFFIITAIQDKHFVIVQCPLTMERKRMSLNLLKITDLKLENVEENMKIFDVQRLIDSQGIIKIYESSEDYKESKEIEEYRNATDFERFKIDLKRRVENDILKEKGLIN